MKIIAVTGALLSIAIGLTATVGWALGLPVLTQFFATRSAMQPITAICAILTGTGILSVAAIKAARPFAVLISISIMATAVLTLAQYALAVDLGLDHLLFNARVNEQIVPYPYPGRMAAPTAAAFGLVAAALLLSQTRDRPTGLLMSACATAVLLLVIISFLSYFYMVAPLTGILGFTQVSIPTASALGGLSIGVLALRPDDGWVRLLIGHSVGATAARWLLPVVVIVPVTVAALALRGSEIGLYPVEFRLAFITGVTIVLLAALALWGAWQLDRHVAIRRTAEALQESEATLRAFFETEGLFASIIEQDGENLRYLAANPALSELIGRTDLAGGSMVDVQSRSEADLMLERLEQIQSTGMSVSFEQALETGAGTRWFAVTISPITNGPSNLPRYATAAFEITMRKRAEEQQELLKGELSHRLKNVLTVVQSVASQTLRQAADLPEANRALSARLSALGEATDVLTAQSWEAADLRTLIDKALAAHGGINERVLAEGPDFTLQPQVTLALALALHELATNATKYGALSNATGHVDIRWHVADGTDGAAPRFHFCWQEIGGPQVHTPTRRGFGSMMIERSLTAYFRGEASIAYPHEGVVFTLNCPLEEAGSTGASR